MRSGAGERGPEGAEAGVTVSRALVQRLRRHVEAYTAAAARAWAPTGGAGRPWNPGSLRAGRGLLDLPLAQRACACVLVVDASGRLQAGRAQQGLFALRLLLLGTFAEDRQSVAREPAPEQLLPELLHEIEDPYALSAWLDLREAWLEPTASVLETDRLRLEEMRERFTTGRVRRGADGFADPHLQRRLRARLNAILAPPLPPSVNLRALELGVEEPWCAEILPQLEALVREDARWAQLLLTLRQRRQGWPGAARRRAVANVVRYLGEGAVARLLREWTSSLGAGAPLPELPAALAVARGLILGLGLAGGRARARALELVLERLEEHRKEQPRAALALARAAVDSLVGILEAKAGPVPLDDGDRGALRMLAQVREWAWSEVAQDASAALARLAKARGERPAVLAARRFEDFGLRGPEPVEALHAPAAVDRRLRRGFDLMRGALHARLREAARWLEGGLCGTQTLPYAAWRSLVLDHPVVGVHARKLVWSLRLPVARGPSPCPRRTSAAWDGERLCDVEGRTLPDPAEDGTEVGLWHPAEASLEEVEAWRERLAALEVEQPFAQAWRSLHVPSEEECAAGSVSARFAGEFVLRAPFEHLLMAMCWRPWPGEASSARDAVRTVGRSLGDGGWRAACRLHGPSFDPHAELGGVFFHRGPSAVGLDDAVPLHEVPPRVFSEALGDLIRAVDPARIALDHRLRMRRSERAQERKRRARGDVRERLEVLVAALPEGKRWELRTEGLVVHGVQRDYLVHLESSQCYTFPRLHGLCIVVAGAPRTPALRGLEQDDRLDLIVSKALLLTRDDLITDRILLMQLDRVPTRPDPFA